MINNKQLTANKQQFVKSGGYRLSAGGCKLKNGQALITAILIIFALAMTIGLTATTANFSQMQHGANDLLSQKTQDYALSCMDNVLMRFSRGDYSVPDNLLTGNLACTINISGNLPTYRLLAVAEGSSLFSQKKATKKIQADVNINAEGVLTVSSFKEIE